MATAADLLTAWAARIEALTPVETAGVDDRYRVVIGLRHAYLGSRAVMLTCQPGRRVQSGRMCSDWETQATIEVWYVDQPGGNAYSRAVRDAEQIADDLYDWVSSAQADTDGLLRVDVELAQIDGSENELVCSRGVRLVYRGN